MAKVKAKPSMLDAAMQRRRWHLTHAGQLYYGSHAMIKRMYIERHKLAARKVLCMGVEASHGNCYMLADVGPEAKRGRLGACVSRLPEWLVHDSALPLGQTEHS